MTDSLLQEIDADVRAEKLARLWARWRKPLFTAAALIVAATAASSIWEHYREQRGGALMVRMSDATALLDQGKSQEAATTFAALAEDMSGESRIVAQLWQARALMAAHKQDEAIAVLSTASHAPAGLWSDIACLRLASLDSSKANCLTNGKNSPLLSQRREWQAALLWHAGETEEAIALLEQLATSPDTPDASRERIDQWLSTLRSGNTAK